MQHYRVLSLHFEVFLNLTAASRLFDSRRREIARRFGSPYLRNGEQRWYCSRFVARRFLHASAFPWLAEDRKTAVSFLDHLCLCGEYRVDPRSNFGTVSRVLTRSITLYRPLPGVPSQILWHDVTGENGRMHFREQWKDVKSFWIYNLYSLPSDSWRYYVTDMDTMLCVYVFISNY